MEADWLPYRTTQHVLSWTVHKDKRFVFQFCVHPNYLIEMIDQLGHWCSFCLSSPEANAFLTTLTFYEQNKIVLNLSFIGDVYFKSQNLCVQHRLWINLFKVNQNILFNYKINFKNLPLWYKISSYFITVS